MKKKTKSKKFPYVVQAWMVDKVLCLLFLPFYFYFLWETFNQRNIAETQDKLSLLVFVIVFSIALLVIILKVFFAKSVLEDKWIMRTNVFLMKRRIVYEEINDVGITFNNSGVRLNLVDGSSVSLYCGDIVEAVNVMSLVNKKIKANEQQRTNNELSFRVPETTLFATHSRIELINDMSKLLHLDNHQKLAAYIKIIKSFVNGEITVQTFERDFLKMFKNDSTMWQAAEFEILNRLFTDIDAFCDDSFLRVKSDINEVQLREQSKVALQKLLQLSENSV